MKGDNMPPKKNPCDATRTIHVRGKDDFDVVEVEQACTGSAGHPQPAGDLEAGHTWVDRTDT